MCPLNPPLLTLNPLSLSTPPSPSPPFPLYTIGAMEALAIKQAALKEVLDKVSDLID